MSRNINQPVSQIKLTNVSLVRLKKGKKRFEIACYKNKVLEWRSGIETDLDNVLQIPNVFLNVSKGQSAPTAELIKAFGADATTESVVLEILRKGEMQVGDKERAAQLERVHHEVIDLVAGKLVDPRTRRVYTTGMIEKALDMISTQAHQHHQGGGAAATAAAAAAAAAAAEGETPAEAPVKTPMWTGVTTAKSAKSQALDAMKALVALQPIPVMRARMRLRVSCTTSVLKQPVKATAAAGAASSAGPVVGTPSSGGKGGGKNNKKGQGRSESAAAVTAPHQNKDEDEDGSQRKAAATVKDRILGYIEQVESQDVIGSTWEVAGFVEPGAYKALSDFVSNETRGQGRVEVLDVAVTHDD
ncbi:upf0023 family protein [Grosmannia clavigera kw1407]|uniref:Upf0023 family protein n=1 Tax=Grosmannia clavigera (strain kw1407 / UAMH 11150) TaxID=655863 RepID=F0XPL4_GROCL|nr:upf0023 family protein [Grosmannia clavigera kw1407]EFX00364.1 upf0023 family protein [Grosmannia clavigera kw1407]